MNDQRQEYVICNHRQCRGEKNRAETQYPKQREINLKPQNCLLLLQQSTHAFCPHILFIPFFFVCYQRRTRTRTRPDCTVVFFFLPLISILFFSSFPALGRNLQCFPTTTNCPVAACRDGGRPGFSIVCLPRFWGIGLGEWGGTSFLPPFKRGAASGQTSG